MFNRNVIVGVIALFCLCRAEAASAQPRWGRERMPQAGACFYEDPNFKGRYFCVRPGDRLQSMPDGMGDKVSSLRLVGSTEVTVFRDKELRGRSARFIGDVRNLKREGWNDQISSVDVKGGAMARWRNDRAPVWGSNELTPREGACFYEDVNFKGQYFCAPRGATYVSLPRGFNDKISSIRVFDSEVRLFKNRNFGGRSAEIRADAPNLRGSWSDTVSSIRVF
ncbi:MAG: peptidase inhibitor family I36 protein [Acidobacteriota bacterium]